jgi:hypothetical protein
MWMTVMGQLSHPSRAHQPHVGKLLPGTQASHTPSQLSPTGNTEKAEQVQPGVNG